MPKHTQQFLLLCAARFEIQVCRACPLQIGQYHDISAGLLIGGKAVKEEQERVNSLNIIIATPGKI